MEVAVSQEPVVYEVVDDIAVITLNRPEKMNAMSATLLDELERCFDRAKRDTAVNVALLQGAGRGAPEATLSRCHANARFGGGSSRSSWRG